MTRKYTIRDPNYHKKHSKAMKKLYSDPEFKKKKDDKTREVQSDPAYKEMRSITAKERCSDPAIRKIMSERAKKVWSDPTYKEEQINKRNTPEYKAMLSNTHQNQPSGENCYRYGKPVARIHGSWFTLPNKDQIWLRSSYEVRILNILINCNIKWEYESKIFPLTTLHTTYCPDFYLPEYDLWIEVKGWMSEVAKTKLECFYVEYPNEKLKILYQEDIIHIENALKTNQTLDITQFGTTEIR